MSDGFGKKVSRVLFWRYRRGGWQYDILCILILLFIFLVPRSVLDGSFFKGSATAEETGMVEKPGRSGDPSAETKKKPGSDEGRAPEKL